MQLHPSVDVDTTDDSPDSPDRQNLTQVRRRFLRINADRLQRTRLSLNHQQDNFLTALPLLFHCNHPMLPGFVSHNTVAGICGHKPDKTEINCGKALARSFHLAGGYHGDDIWAIFLMGSVGTLAQSSHSDFDIWLCHKPGLERAALQELEQKCQRISQWAKTLRLDVHFFLMDNEAFRAGAQLNLDAESSGSAQRFLLLDEFYRTALHLAGRLPLWWFIPASQEANYDERARELLHKRFLQPESVLDFGPVSRIPDGEFIGAGIWQLYKAIGSPYKSALKLLLLEAYVHAYPAITPLALDYKQLVYGRDLPINDLDPYLLVYRRIARYLEEDGDQNRRIARYLEENGDQNRRIARYLEEDGDQNRLELARRCLYFKVNKTLSRAPAQRSESWQRELMGHLTQEWGWSADYLKLLDQRSAWKALQVKEERNQLVQALNHSYQMLLDFVQRSGAARSISTTELHELGRKLQAAFERRPGKLEWINPGISKDISEAALGFTEAKTIENDSRKEAIVWQVYAWEGDTKVLLRQTDSPVELLFWCYANRIIEGHVRLETGEAPSTSESQLRRTLGRLQQWLPLPLPPAPHEVFKRQAVPTHALMLINVAAETPSPFGGQVHRLSSNSDALRYGGMEENLVASIDLLVRNSWQELTCQRFSGKHALLLAMQAYLSLCLPGTHQAPPQLEIDCLGTAHTTLIAQRVRQWFHEIAACYYSGNRPPATRYLFALADRLYSLQFQGPKLILLNHKDLTQLQHYLGEAQRRYSPIVVDSYALHNHPIKLIARRISARAMHVFFQRQPTYMDIYVVDERGSLVRFQGEFTPKLNAIHSLHVFLRAVLRRLDDPQHREMGSDFGVHPIEFHELREDAQHHLSLMPRVISPEATETHPLALLARVRCNEQNQFEYDFECERQSFTWAQFKHDVFYAMAQYILSRRQNDERYPVFVTDLDLDQCREQLSSTRELQISHYLRVKVDLELKLSAAVRALK